MPLFEVAIIKNPTKKELEEGTGTEVLLFGPAFVLASTRENAGLAAVTGPKAPENLDLNRAQVLIRPFA